MTNSTQCVDPVSSEHYPTLAPYNGLQPVLPTNWKCTAVLHPFSKLQSNSTPLDADSPFFEICTATVTYAENEGLNALLVGSSGRRWWYKVRPSGTTVSTNGIDYVDAGNIGWSVPTTNWFGNKSSEAKCSGTGFLNWMRAQQVDWWKIPVGTSTDGKPLPATWMWHDTETKFPTRMMFGQGPVDGPTHGDPTQLALFQMFSFTYFPSFESLPTSPINDPINEEQVEGFTFGNPHHFELFEWNTNFGMTAFMTPVNEAYNPLPTRVLYKWKPEGEYHLSTDRSQNTLMQYSEYNRSNPFSSQVALLTGPAPSGVTPPANSGAGFIINYDGDTVASCNGYINFPFPQEPPTWAQIPGVEGTIQATVIDNHTLCPNHPVTIISVLFPPSGIHYPDNTYLWTWYSPMNDTGSQSRPVTFMQSQSGVNKGTSLALADYFYYEVFSEEIAACNFTVPPSDFTIPADKKWVKTGININDTTSAKITVESGTWTANPHSNGGNLYSAEGNPEGTIAKSGYAKPGVLEGKLVGRVGSTVFEIGMEGSTPHNASGELELCINDDLNGEYGAGYADNKGKINLKIAVSNVH